MQAESRSKGAPVTVEEVTVQPGGGARPRLLRSWPLWCAVVAGVVRLPYLGAPLSSDEGGFLLIGRHWADGGGSLYGPYWVDRPPLLIAIHEVAARTGGTVSLRLIGCLAAVATVCAAWHLGRGVSGDIGARWSAVLATAAVSTPLVASPGVSGELLALPFMVGSVACALRAVAHRTGTRAPFAAAAGVLAACAPLIKQNLIDGFVAIAVLAVVCLLQRWITRRAAVLVLLSAAGSAVVTVALALGLAELRGTHVADLWQALIPFRADAARVISQHASSATTDRLVLMTLISVVGGPFFLAVLTLVAARRSLSPAAATATVLYAWATISIVAGGSYWLHYLLELVPGLCLGIAVTVSSGPRTRRAAQVVAVYALVTAVVAPFVMPGLSNAPTSDREVAGDWLESVARPGDTAVVAWGKPSILVEAGTRSPYEQLWSLPVRVHDPHLTDFVRVLEGSDAPDWVISKGRSVESWGIDSGRADRIIQDRYEIVADVCGYSFRLRNGRSLRVNERSRQIAAIDCPASR